MTSFLFAVVILVVIAMTWMRKQSRQKAKRLSEKGPGRSASHPLRVDRFDDMDALVRLERCHCGGRADVVSEGSKCVDGTQLRVVRADCDDCGEELYFFFKLDHLLH
jgi:hypothetical protein